MTAIRLTVFAFLFVGTLATMLPVMSQGVPLRCAGTPKGIGALEMTWTQKTASEIVTKWKRAGLLDVARKNIRLDYAFVFFYSLLLAFVCQQASTAFTGNVAMAGRAIAWGMLAAGLLDVVENLGMTQMLNEKFQYALVVSICAVVKFGLTLIALLYAFGSHVARPR